MKTLTKKQLTLLASICKDYDLIPCMITPCEVGFSITANDTIVLNNLYSILSDSGLNLSINDTDRLLLVYV